MKKPTTHFAPAAYFCDRYAISRTTWWRFTKTPGFPEAVRFGRAVRWNVAEVSRFLGGEA